MAIERKTVVDQIEVTRAGGVQVRIALLVVDGDEVLSSAWHRTFIPANIDPAAQMAAVNANLSEMGKELVSAEEIDRVVKFHALSISEPSTMPIVLKDE